MMDADHAAIVEEAVATAEANKNGSSGPSAFSVRASDVRPEPIEWLDPGRVAFGMTTLLAGFPGVGKSTILYDLAARTSREGQTVLILTAEDHLASVVRPRLEAAHADLDCVRIVTADVTLPEAVSMLGDHAEEHGAKLITIDPLLAFLDDGTNTHRDHHIRRSLAPLAALAERTRTAVELVLHTNKGRASEPLLRIGGSIGFTGAARSVLLAADDPQDEGRRILAVAKSNLAAFPPPLAYTLEQVTLRGGIETSRVRWLGEAPEVDVGSLLARHGQQDRTAVDEAADFLRASGILETAQLARDLYAAAEAEGIDRKALQRARQQLGAETWREDFQGPYYWGPPNPDNATLSTLSRLDLPAETNPPGPNLDKWDTVGEPLHPDCRECGWRWFHGHAEDCPKRETS